MPDTIYNWSRYWYPHNQHPPLLQSGFLYVPQKPSPIYFKPEIPPVEFEEIANVPCLILLGEPGIGKSQAMTDAYSAMTTWHRNQEGSHRAYSINLKEYSEADLTQELDEVLGNWASGQYYLHLFLDSLDEARLRIETITYILKRRLSEYSEHINRLYLRIACRTADWPVDFEPELKKLWSDDVVQAYILAPLRSQDVEEAAKTNGIDSQTFLQEILQKEVGPLAATPVTLEFLIRSYRQNKKLSSSRFDLYLDGCNALCRETEETHKRRDKLSVGQRLITAARIAACTIFANYFGVDTEAIGNEDRESAYLTLPQLSGGQETVNIVPFSLGEEALRETLNTGLFRGSTHHRVWAHQTYAEFLAAWYVGQHMTSTQIKSLIFHSDGKLAPQLHQTAAWLATMKDEIFWDILAAEPHILLRSDIMTTDVEAKAKLTAALLKFYESEPIRDYNFFTQLSKLHHPNLAEQVRPYLEDTNKAIDARTLAIDIAEACNLQTLQDRLAEIALDSNEALDVRSGAARVVAKIGNSETKGRLKPLALLLTTDERYRQLNDLKRYGLEAAWPTHITADELFNSLTTPKKNDFSLQGVYLSSVIVPHLNITDLPVALAWVEKQPRRYNLPYSFAALMDTILLYAWEHLEMPGIADAFAQAAASRFLKHDPIVEDDYGSGSATLFNEMLRNDDKKRLLLLKNMLPILSKFNRIPFGIHNIPLVIPEDIPWLAQQFATTNVQALEYILVELIRLLLWRNTDKFEIVYYACENDKALDEALGFPFKPVALDSPLAQEMRQREIERKKWETEVEQRENPPPLDPSPKERVISLLEVCESGQFEEWWHLTYLMMFNPNGTLKMRDGGDVLHENEVNLEVYPVWSEFNDHLRSRLIEAAKNYILLYDPNTHEWLESRTLYRPIIAGYKAFRLLMKYAVDFLITLPIEIWRKWALVLFFYLPVSKESQYKNNEEQDLGQTLIRLAYQYTPEAIIEAFLQLIDQENKSGHFLITPYAEIFWDERLARTLLEKVADKNLEPNRMSILLNQLLAHDESKKQAEVFAKSLIPEPLPEEDDARERAIFAVHALMANREDASWSILWPILQQDDEFGKELIRNIAVPKPHHLKFIEAKLDESQLADFYIWLARHFPPGQDPKLEGAIMIEHNIATFRDSMLGHLRQKGTKAACLELQRIIDEYPHIDLKWSLADAQERFRRETWIWPEPRYILELARDKDKGLVEGGKQLLDVIKESLKRLQSNLEDDKFPAVTDLWNDVNWSRVRRLAESLPDESKANFSGQKDNVANVWKHVSWKKIERVKLYTPKDEEHLSDYVARHLVELKTRGIIVNREVNIRHKRGRTDIYIEAFKKNPDGTSYDPITVVIEVKGCWNSQMAQSMEIQLVQEYLSNTVTYGLYLVGWFDCTSWHPSDHRRKQCRKLTLEKLQLQLEKQASELSRAGLQVTTFVLDAGLP